ncbi:MAG: ABC transporter ATP-binding protein [Clostridia bacterium]|nr:ABC transporter ATP-binding protein [Clostridia bacterium]
MEKNNKNNIKETKTDKIESVQETKKVKLSIENITKTFNSKTVVDNVSFDVYDGEFLSILGPSGCGKTTLLRILIGLIKPDGGTILKKGKDITNTKISKRGMGIVFQNYALFENMTVLQNVEYALIVNKTPKVIARKRALTLLKKMHLREFENKKPYELSGGQQQRVAIARTLALKPDIILFDEPMSALDVSTRLELCQELKRVQKEFKTTMIYITHDQEEAFTLSDRIMVMEVSKISQIGTPVEILKNPANDYIKSFVCDNLTNKINNLKHFVELSNEQN